MALKGFVITGADEERFWSKVHRTDDCWIWTASVMWRGYGQFRLNGTMRRAHRVSYLMSYGTIPDGYQVDWVYVYTTGPAFGLPEVPSDPAA